MRQWMKKVTAIGLGLTLLTAVGCSDAADSNTETAKKIVEAGQKVKVTTVLQAQADFVKEIGKDKVEVESLIPMGTNFWQWAPIIAENRKIEASDVFVINGGGMEERWYAQTAADIKLKAKDLITVDPSEGLEKLKLIRLINPDTTDEDRNKERTDPWFYMDPVNAKTEVDNILKGLVAKAPAYKDEFTKNAEDYKKKLDELDKKFADTFAKAKRKEIVSPYPAYQYLTKRYGVKYYVPDYLSYNQYPFDEPDKQVAVKNDLAQHDLTTIFFEQEAAPRVAEFAAALNYKTAVLNPYEGKYDGEYKSYLQVQEENLKALTTALNE